MAALQDAGPARQGAEQPRATMQVCGKRPRDGDGGVRPLPKTPQLSAS